MEKIYPITERKIREYIVKLSILKLLCVGANQEESLTAMNNKLGRKHTISYLQMVLELSLFMWNDSNAASFLHFLIISAFWTLVSSEAFFLFFQPNWTYLSWVDFIGFQLQDCLLFEVQMDFKQIIIESWKPEITSDLITFSSLLDKH